MRRLLEDNVSLERAHQEMIGENFRGRAATSTVEALMFSLRERGTMALEEPDTRPRLGELSDEQAIEVGTRLRKLKPDIAKAWSADEVLILMQTREQLK
jgi:hypothetical protein